MKLWLKIAVWILPLLGVALGCGWAYVSYHGLFIAWQQVGSPGEAVQTILGVRDGHKLLVETETGDLYSLDFLQGEVVNSGDRLVWERQESSQVDRVVSVYEAGFSAPQPRFEPSQLYRVEYIYKVEGTGEVRFALDSSGSLWMWSHRAPGLGGMQFFLLPAIGLLGGLAVVLFIALARWLVRAFKPGGGALHAG